MNYEQKERILLFIVYRLTFVAVAGIVTLNHRTQPFIGMEVQTFTIRNRLGLHARAAALLVKTANRFVSEITIEKDGLEVNGKSIMGILMLAASRGSKITLKVEGKDAAQAIKTLGDLIENKFGEE
jgi:phosphocarrier protein